MLRQAEGSEIVFSARSVNEAQVPDIPDLKPDLSGDVSFLEVQGDEAVQAAVMNLMVDRFPDIGIDPLTDVMLLSPIRKSGYPCGTTVLNGLLREALNPRGRPEDEWVYGFGKEAERRCWRVGDKVLQTRNNPELGIVNGDIGRITGVDPLRQKVLVNFGNGEVALNTRALEDLVGGYAITVHKSQGSEASTVVLVLPDSLENSSFLTRKLVYTAMTRAKDRLILVESRRAFANAVKRVDPDRLSRLARALRFEIARLEEFADCA